MNVSKRDRQQHAGADLHDSGAAAEHAPVHVRADRQHHLCDGQVTPCAMGLSTAARTGLTALCKSISHEIASDNVTVNNLLPERIDTSRQRFMAERMMKEQGTAIEEARRQIADSISAKRFGLPTELADACAFLCSSQAGFILGQNLQLDGGSYDGLI